MLIDSHAHMDRIPKNKIDEVLKRAKDNGVKHIISNGVDNNSNKLALELSKKYEMIKPALGLYPTEKIQDLDSYLKDIQKSNPIAIGEVGMDFKEILFDDKINKSNKTLEQEKKRQQDTFHKVSEFCEKNKLPIITHSRKAERELVNILESYKIKPRNIIMHCFSGRFNLVRRIRDNGWNFSIPTNIVRSEHFQKIVSETPINQILTETDTPFLSPFKKNQGLVDKDSEIDINEPGNITHSIKKITQLKKMDQTEIENNIYFNFQKIFL